MAAPVSRRTLFAGIAAVAVGTAAACTSSPSPVQQPARKTLSVGATLEPATLDLTTSTEASIPQVLLYNVYETLVKLDSEGTIRPLLASRWDTSNDGKTYTFTLDPAAKFASGTPVNAAAVIASINRMRNATNATAKRLMSLVTNVEQEDDNHVVVTLSQPSNNWLYWMTSTPGIIVDPAVTDLATKPMGSGPFAFSSWTKGDRIVLTKNAQYWGTPGRFDEVSFRYFLDPNAMVAAMLTGDLDIISNLQAPSTLTQFSDTGRYTIVEGTTNGEVVMGFNHQRSNLANLQVRQAICSAIDRAALVKTVWDGHGRLLGSMVPPTDPYYEDLSNTYPYDPEKAKQLLAQSGVTLPTLRFRVPTTKYATDSAQFIASQLRAVGITCQIEELDFTRWYNEVFTNGDYDLTIVAHVEARDIGRFADPAYYWHYDNPEFQTLMQRADAASSDQFVPLMKEAAKMLADDAAANWLFLMPNLVVTKSTISGVAANATTLSFDLTPIASR